MKQEKANEQNYGIRRSSVRRGLDTTLLIIEGKEPYVEDYQMRMMEENEITGVLCPRGLGEQESSVYQYEISGKVSLKSRYKEDKIRTEEMLRFSTGLLHVIHDVKKYLLDPARLLLLPEYIFCEDNEYYFCYYPEGIANMWEAFHRLTEYFVQWTDFRDDDSVRTSFFLHKETMGENYSLRKIIRQLEKMKEQEKQKALQEKKQTANEKMPDESTSFYDSVDHDWIASQKTGTNIMRETENMWKPVRDFLRRHKKPSWKDWDGIYIDEEDL